LPAKRRNVPQQLTSQLTSERRAFLTTELVGRRELGLALAAVGISALLFAVSLPFASLHVGRVDAFIPAYESALVVCDLITAVLLFGQFVVLRSKAMFALACGYIFTAFAAFAHLISFPGAFSPTGLLGAGTQTTIWEYVFWHGGFPLFVIAYALLKGDRRSAAPLSGTVPRAGTTVLYGIAAVFALTCGLAWIALRLGQFLPVLVHDQRFDATFVVIIAGICALCLTALAIVWLRRARTVLDLWLMVVLCTWLFDIALSCIFNTGRFDFGWYAGRLYGVFAASVLLIVFLTENGAHYLRLAQLSVASATANTALERLSQHDGLTDLANRRHFDSYLDGQIAVARRQGRALALVMCDVDCFKAYNDHFGHQAGDECLKQVAAALQKCCRRPGDMAARYGGEEFALILPDTDLAGAARIAEIARREVARLMIPHARSPATPFVTISGGVSILAPGQVLTMKELVRVADGALFAAKRAGRNRVISVDVVWLPASHAAMPGSSAMSGS
jgi:diguanylate cyclase (GGDEF)-like protein